MALLKVWLCVFETRLGDSVDATGMDVSDAAAIGFRYDFSWRTPHTQ
jgi:hypothetical protein